LPRSWRRSIHRSRLINAVGAVLTAIVLIVVLVTKFTHGAYLVVIAIPALFVLMRTIHRHYTHVRASPRDVVCVYIPEYVVGRWWENVLHHQSSLRLKGRLLFEPGVMVTQRSLAAALHHPPRPPARPPAARRPPPRRHRTASLLTSYPPRDSWYTSA
jgi:hypothetical protein